MVHLPGIKFKYFTYRIQLRKPKKFFEFNVRNYSIWIIKGSIYILEKEFSKKLEFI